jgi:hypothetical protein
VRIISELGLLDEMNAFLDHSMKGISTQRYVIIDTITMRPVLKINCSECGKI